MGSQGRGSGTDRKCKITVRHGATLAHVQTIEAAADLMRLLFEERSGQQQHGLLEQEAQRVIIAAVEATHLLGGGTVAKGWQRWKKSRPPLHLVRDVRQLDAASALLRHPGAAGDIVKDLMLWIEKAEPPDDEDEELGQERADKVYMVHSAGLSPPAPAKGGNRTKSTVSASTR